MVPLRHQRAEPLPGEVVRVEIGRRAEVRDRYLVVVLAEIHRPGEGGRRPHRVPLRQERGQPVVVGGVAFQEVREDAIRLPYLGLFLFARLALAVVEVVEVHVVMVERPVRRLGIGVVGVAVGGVKPGAADVERNAEIVARRPGPAADPVHGLDDGETPSRGPQYLRGGKARRARSHDNHVDIAHLAIPVSI